MSARRVRRGAAVASLLLATVSSLGPAQNEAAAAKPEKAAHAKAKKGAGKKPKKTAGAKKKRKPPSGASAGMLAAHNRARAAVGAPPLKWSNDLARHAQQWASHMASRCDLQHRSGGRYGENLGAAASNMGAPRSTPDQVVGQWLAEKRCWKPGVFRKTDRCDSSCAAKLQSTGCGHYTQVVWSGTQRVGCGRATCSKGGMDWEFWVCNYDPRGNVVGQRPY
jgi:pathogenesis-related protein 1